MTVMDNLTELEASQQLEPGNNWRKRFVDPRTDKRDDDDYSPINENHYYQPERIIKMPKLATGIQKVACSTMKLMKVFTFELQRDRHL